MWGTHLVIVAAILSVAQSNDLVAEARGRDATTLGFSKEVINAITAFAKKNGWEPRALGAIVQVESGGQVYAKVKGQDMPVILYEYHIFYKYLPAAKRATAVKQNLARSAWKALPYAKTQEERYEQLRKASLIDEEAAYKSCSWGVGQVMGFNAEYVGYKNAKELAKVAMSGVNGQLDLMVRFIKKKGLDKKLAAKDWAGFASGYNGAGQVSYYSGKMRDAYASLGGVKWTADGATTTVKPSGVIPGTGPKKDPPKKAAPKPDAKKQDDKKPADDKKKDGKDAKDTEPKDAKDSKPSQPAKDAKPKDTKDSGNGKKDNKPNDSQDAKDSKGAKDSKDSDKKEPDGLRKTTSGLVVIDGPNDGKTQEVTGVAPRAVKALAGDPAGDVTKGWSATGRYGSINVTAVGGWTYAIDLTNTLVRQFGQRPGVLSDEFLLTLDDESRYSLKIHVWEHIGKAKANDHLNPKP